MDNIAAGIKVIAFDVFGTVVDWHGSVTREVNEMDLGIDGAAFARAWRAGYQPAMAEVMANNEWIILDVLHRRILDRVLVIFKRGQDNYLWEALGFCLFALQALLRFRKVTPR